MTILQVGLCRNSCHVIYVCPIGDGRYVEVTVSPSGYTVDLIG